jgi:hypothetical protein
LTVRSTASYRYHLRGRGPIIVFLVRPFMASLALVAALVVGAPSVVAAPTSRGYDISWPQCGGAYPVNAGFGIVGVNRGIVFSLNPCLASEVGWAGNAKAQLYANTGNPGPSLSSHWPTGQTTPRWCDPTNADSADCAFDYGYNAAADSFQDAVNAFASLGVATSPAASHWWLDVETSNSWRTDTALNVAALQGEASYLTSVARVAKLGIYSTQYQWNQIAGGSKAFVANRSWVAGVGGEKNARSKCGGAGFTGGGVELAQYAFAGFDADLAC